MAVAHIVPYADNEDLGAKFAEDSATHLGVLTSACDGLLLQIFPPEIHNPYVRELVHACVGCGQCARKM